MQTHYGDDVTSVEKFKSLLLMHHPEKTRIDADGAASESEQPPRPKR